MKIAPFAIAGAFLFAVSGKRKKAVSAGPAIEKIGRVERLLNSAAIKASIVQSGQPPSLIYLYTSKDGALERVTAVMKVQADLFPSVQYYQAPVSVVKQVMQMGGSSPSGVSGVLAGMHSDDNVWPTFIYPKDEIKDIAVKVAHRIFFAMHGIRPEN